VISGKYHLASLMPRYVEIGSYAISCDRALISSISNKKHAIDIKTKIETYGFAGLITIFCEPRWY
jgi:hypothetical protein